LQGVVPFYKVAKNRTEEMQMMYQTPLVNPPGTKMVYSDAGIILLGEIIERLTGFPLDSVAAANIFQPIGMRDTEYNPAKTLLPRIAPTEFDKDFRHRQIHGEVHDENAWVLGGVAGHAGLFATAESLAKFSQMMLNGGIYAHHRILKRSTVEMLTTRQN